MKSLYSDCQFQGLPRLLVGGIPPGAWPVVPEGNYHSIDHTFGVRHELDNPSEVGVILGALHMSLTWRFLSCICQCLRVCSIGKAVQENSSHHVSTANLTEANLETALDWGGSACRRGRSSGSEFLSPAVLPSRSMLGVTACMSPARKLALMGLSLRMADTPW